MWRLWKPPVGLPPLTRLPRSAWSACSSSANWAMLKSTSLTVPSSPAGHQRRQAGWTLQNLQYQWQPEGDWGWEEGKQVSSPNSTLEGLMSLCRTPLACRWHMAAASCLAAHMASWSLGCQPSLCILSASCCLPSSRIML